MVATTSAVRVIDLAAGAISTVASLGTTGLTVDGDGSLILGGGSSVRRFDVRSGQLETLATGLNDVRGVAVDATGRIYVVETGAHRIRLIPERGVPEPPPSCHEVPPAHSGT